MKGLSEVHLRPSRLCHDRGEERERDSDDTKQDLQGRALFNLKLAVENSDYTQNPWPAASMSWLINAVQWRYLNSNLVALSLTLRDVLSWPSARWPVECESA